MSKRSIITLTTLAAASLVWANIGFAAPKEDGESRLQRYNSERTRSIEQRDTRNTSKAKENRSNSSSSIKSNSPSKNNYSTPKSTIKQQRNERQQTGTSNRSERLRVEQARESINSTNRSSAAQQRAQEQTRRAISDSNSRNNTGNTRQAETKRSLERQAERQSEIKRNLNRQAERQTEVKRNLNRQAERQANYRDNKRSNNHRPRVVVNQHYHRPGYHIRRLPTGIRRLYHRSFPLYYFGGTYYRPGSNGFTVISAPIGVRVKSLPVGFATLILGGISYYHVNDVYYRQQGNEYIVVDTPVETASANIDSSVYASGDWVIYPRYGQSDEQLQQDRYECHLWAFERTNYDPSQPYQDNSLRSDYYRAQAACLEGRGYTIN